MAFTILRFVCALLLFNKQADSRSCLTKVTWEDASGCCRAVGTELIAMENRSSILRGGQVMKDRNLTSVWLRLRRIKLPQWTWTNNVIDNFQGTSPRKLCVAFNVTSKRLHTENCASTGYGHLCEKKDCPDCSALGSFASACKIFNNTCYLYLCEHQGWANAKTSCTSKGLHMAIMRQQGIKDNLASHRFGCQAYWVGLRKEEWIPVNKTTTVNVSRWGHGEPSNLGNCAVMTWDRFTFTWRTAKCSDKHHVICETSIGTTLQTNSSLEPRTQPSFTTEPTTGHQHVTVIAAVVGGLFGVVFIIAIIVAVWCFYTRLQSRFSRRTSKYQEQESIPMIKKSVGATTVKQALIDSLMRSHKKTELWSFLDETVEMTLDDIFTDMTLVKEENGRHSSTPVKHYTDIFKPDQDGQHPRRVLLYGEAGAGKTTLVKKFLVDWCQSEMAIGRQQKHKTQQQSLPRFKYIVPVFLRDVRKTDKNLKSVISRQLDLDSRARDNLWGEVLEHKRESLLILDGYDEFDETDSPELMSVLANESLVGINILITCRAPYSFHLPREKNMADVKVDLHGFSKSSVQTYITKFFKVNEGISKTKESCNELVRKIENSEDLTFMSKFPAILLLMCVLWADRGVLSDTYTGFYADFVRYMCVRYGKKYFDPSTKIDHIFEQFKQELLRIGKVAVDGLREESIKLIFTLQEVESEVKDVGMKLGFFRRDMKTADTQYICFHHRTIQEFFTAFYIVYCEETERLALLTSFCSSKSRLLESKMILKFVAGLGGSDIRRIVEQALNGWDADATREKTDFLLTYLEENKEVKVELPSTIEIEIASYHSQGTYDRFFKMPGQKVEIVKIVTNKVEDARFLLNLEAPRLTEVHLLRGMVIAIPMADQEFTEITSDQLGIVLTKFNLKKLIISGFLSTENAGISCLLANLDELNTLEYLELSELHISSQLVLHIASKLPELLALQGISLKDCAKDAKGGLERLLASLTLTPKLKTINLSGNRTGTELFKCLPSFLQSKPQLVELRLCDFHGPPDTCAPQEYVSAISTLRDLQVFEAGKNTLNMVGMQNLGLALSKLNALQELYLVETGCKHSDAWNGFMQDVTQASKIRMLDLSDNDLGSKCVDRLVNILPKLSMLHTLDLNGCNIALADTVLKLIQCIPKCPSLRRLGLSDNGFGDDLLKITKKTDKLKQLENLSLSNNNFSTDIRNKIKRMLQKACPNMDIEIEPKPSHSL